MIAILVSTLAGLLSCVSSYSLCSTAPYPYEGKDIPPIPIVQTQESVQGIGYKLSGFIKITDKCGFATQNLTVTGIPANTSLVATWFGGFPGDASGISLTDATPVQFKPDSPVSQNFEFTKRAGASVSYNDFTEFRLFIESVNILLARAEITNTTVQKTVVPSTATVTSTMNPSGVSIPSPTYAAVKPTVSPQQQSGASETTPMMALIVAATLFSLF